MTAQITMEDVVNVPHKNWLEDLAGCEEKEATKPLVLPVSSQRLQNRGHLLYTVLPMPYQRSLM